MAFDLQVLCNGSTLEGSVSGRMSCNVKTTGGAGRAKDGEGVHYEWPREERHSRRVAALSLGALPLVRHCCVCSLDGTRYRPS
jgi:hypothetical protein